MDSISAAYGVKFLDPGNVSLEIDQFQDLKLILKNGQTYPQARAVQALPLSRPYAYIEFRDRDGREIGILEDADRLDRKAREALEIEIEKAYFLPVITRIISIERAFPGSDWYVETDRGEKRFKLRWQRESRSIGGGRVLIRDLEGTKYLVRDRRQLDQRSQKLLDEFV